MCSKYFSYHYHFSQPAFEDTRKHIDLDLPWSSGVLLLHTCARRHYCGWLPGKIQVSKYYTVSGSHKWGISFIVSFSSIMRYFRNQSFVDGAKFCSRRKLATDPKSLVTSPHPPAGFEPGWW